MWPVGAVVPIGANERNVAPGSRLRGRAGGVDPGVGAGTSDPPGLPFRRVRPILRIAGRRPGGRRADPSVTIYVARPVVTPARPALRPSGSPGPDLDPSGAGR